ncbi:MAG: PEP-CTERM sorting domain-containing protein [Mariniblastus sp.]|nr:PEP-CTERM sorting domain-containing protein [Mariniblastus sp.]MDG2180489.1 PEP-CTERM sorting domain-containing protein [Mariniblastus sp.]
MKTQLFVLLTSLFLLVTNVSADIVVTFSDGSTSGTEFFANTGETVTMFVTVEETLPNTEMTDNFLIGFGLKADYAAVSGSVATITSNSVDAAFDTTTDASFTGSQLNLAGIDIDFASNGLPQGPTILLGKFDLLLSSPGTTQFEFGDYDSALDDFVTSSAQKLDGIIFANSRTFDFTISAVPEPSAISLLTLIGIAAMARRRKRLA